MNIAVRYFSKTGNTKKLAERIAQTVGVKAESIPASVDNADVLFLGASVYWAGIDSKVKEYIRSLKGKKIGKVVVFSTSALAERGFPAMKKLLEENGLTVADKDFYCRGEFTALHKGRPNEDDLKAAEEFARQFI